MGTLPIMQCQGFTFRIPVAAPARSRGLCRLEPLQVQKEPDVDDAQDILSAHKVVLEMNGQAREAEHDTVDEDDEDTEDEVDESYNNDNDDLKTSQDSEESIDLTDVDTFSLDSGNYQFDEVCMTQAVDMALSG
jgi:hypothetical protein